MQPVGQLGETWIAWCQAEGISLNTILRRRAVLATIGDAGTADRDQVEPWWATRRHLSPATRANDLACLRAFYKWAQRWEHRADDPTIRLDAPKVPQGQPRPISDADLAHVLATSTGPAHRAILLGAYAGLRISEAAAADWADVEGNRLRATGKGSKTRTVSISPELPGMLGGPARSGNIVRQVGACDTRALARIVRQAFKAADVDVTFHQLRHRFATVGLRASHDLVAVGRQLGHASPATTAVYTAIADETGDLIAAAVTL